MNEFDQTNTNFKRWSESRCGFWNWGLFLVSALSWESCIKLHRFAWIKLIRHLLWHCGLLGAEWKCKKVRSDMCCCLCLLEMCYRYATHFVVLFVVVLMQEDLCTCAKGFFAYMCCLFDCCICFFWCVSCVRCPYLHWSCFTDLGAIPKYRKHW